MSETEREAWRMEFTFEFQDEEEADAIFKAFTDSLEDMEELFSDIDLGKVSTSMTINAPATTLLALYVATADN